MNVSVEIKNGIYDLLTSGIVLVNGNESTTLSLKIDDEQLNLVIKFENNEKDGAKVKKEASVINNTTLGIVFTNYNNSIGNYTKEFWNIGSIKNRKVYWGYSIFGLTEGNIKKMDYSFYLGEEVTNG